MEKTIKLSEVIEICNDIVAGKYTTEDEITEILDKIRVVNYITLMEKYEILLNILYAPAYFDDGIEQKAMYLETAKLWQGLFAYTNVDVKSEPHLKTMQNYDLIMSVVGDILISLCYNDYNRLCQMIETCISFEHVLSVSEKLTEIDVNKLGEYTEDTKNIIDYVQTHKKEFELLQNIVEFNDPQLKELKDEINQAAAKAANKKD
jgi:beta-mannanase